MLKFLLVEHHSIMVLLGMVQELILQMKTAGHLLHIVFLMTLYFIQQILEVQDIFTENTKNMTVMNWMKVISP